LQGGTDEGYLKAQMLGRPTSSDVLEVLVGDHYKNGKEHTEAGKKMSCFRMEKNDLCRYVRRDSFEKLCRKIQLSVLRGMLKNSSRIRAESWHCCGATPERNQQRQRRSAANGKGLFGLDSAGFAGRDQRRHSLGIRDLLELDAAPGWRAPKDRGKGN